MESIVKVLWYCFLLYKHFNLAEGAQKFSCEVPDSWQSASHNSFYEEGAHYSDDVAALNLYGDRDPTKWLWPNAVVPFTIDRRLSPMDEEEVFKAFDEYHTKTCVRFEPKQELDEAFVNIEINNTLCGIASVGRRGGYQYAQFGKECKAAKVMIHELGHTLGLFHEHQRQDRDNYLEFSSPECNPNEMSRILGHTQASGLYNYQSVMHYPCHNCQVGVPTYSREEVPSCGLDLVRGLSFLDADHINSLYNCQGCLRHRWRNLQELTMRDMANLPLFGLPVTPCRILIQGQVVVGHIAPGQRDPSCIIPYLNQVYKIKNNIEVLVIPNDPKSKCKYTLQRSSTISLTDAIVATAKNYDTRNQVYIAYSFGTASNNGNVQIGEVIGFKGKFVNGPEIPVGDSVLNPREFKVLTCSCSETSNPNPPTTFPVPSTTTKTPTLIPSSIPRAILVPVSQGLPHRTRGAGLPMRGEHHHRNNISGTPNWGVGDWWKCWNIKKNGGNCDLNDWPSTSNNTQGYVNHRHRNHYRRRHNPHNHNVHDDNRHNYNVHNRHNNNFHNRRNRHPQNHNLLWNHG